jgi:hypothetical protein
MTEALTPEVVDILVERHRRFLQFLEPRVGNRAVAEELPLRSTIRPSITRLAFPSRLGCSIQLSVSC